MALGDTGFDVKIADFSRHDSSDSDHDDDDDDDGGNESSSGEELSLAVSRPRRSTAGARMSALIDAEADDELSLLFAEDENDAEFEIERRGQRDDVRQEGAGDGEEVFDDAEDVDMSSSSDEDEDKGPNLSEGDDLEGEKELQKRTREEARKRKRRAAENLRLMALRKRAIVTSAAARTLRGVKHEELQRNVAGPRQPSGLAAEEKATALAAKKRKKSERVSWLPVFDDVSRRSSSRRQTMANKEQTQARLKTSEEKRVRLIATMERAAKRKEKLKAKAMTQAERLEEAERTERLNSKSLNRWEEMERKRIEEQQERLRALQDRRLEGAVFTYWSGPAKWVDGKLVKIGVTEVRNQHEPPSKKRKAKDTSGEQKVSKASKVTGGPTITTAGLVKTESNSRPTTASIGKVEQEPSSALSRSTSFPYSSRPHSRGHSQGADAGIESPLPDAEVISSQLISENGYQINPTQLHPNSSNQSVHPTTQHQPQNTSVIPPVREEAHGHIMPHRTEGQQPTSFSTSTLQAGVPDIITADKQTFEVQGPHVQSFEALLLPNQSVVTANGAIRESSPEVSAKGVTQVRPIFPSMHAHTIPFPVSLCSRLLRDREVGSDRSQQVGQMVDYLTSTTVTEQDQTHPQLLSLPTAPKVMTTGAPPHKPVIEYTSRESYIFTDIEGLTREQKSDYAVLLESQNPVEPAPARATATSKSRSTKPSKSNRATIELCPITSKPAKYRDPLTSLAYASALAYKEIRETLNHRYAWSTVLGCFCGPLGVGARGVPERFLAPNMAPKDIDVKPDDVTNTGAADVGRIESPQDSGWTVGARQLPGTAGQQQQQRPITPQTPVDGVATPKPSLESTQSVNVVSTASTTPVPLSQSMPAQYSSSIAPAPNDAAPLFTPQPSTSFAIPPVASSATSPMSIVHSASAQPPGPNLAAQNLPTSTPASAAAPAPAPAPAPASASASSAAIPMPAVPMPTSINQTPVAVTATEHTTVAPAPTQQRIASRSIEAGRGEGEREGSAERKSSSPASFVDASGFQFGNRDRKTVKLKLRKGFTKHLFESSNDNGDKDDGDHGQGGAQDNDTISTTGDGSSPIIPEIDLKTMALFPTGRPRETPLDTVICKHCKKPVLRIGAVEHIRGCYKAKQEKQRKKKEARDAANKLKHGEKEKEKSKTAGDDDNDEGDIPSVSGSTKTSKKSALKDIGGNKKGKKRKAENDDDQESASVAVGGNSATGNTVKKKKKKDEPKKMSKFKGPVDVERQCGVQLPNGGQCARSLTCKSHSMGAKRAVPGRSLPYDMLLQAYQKKNQARQQKAAIDANAPVADEDNGSGKVDSDDEKEQCMMGIERMWMNREAGSLAGHRLVNTRMKYRMARVRDIFRQAIGGDVPGVLGGGNGAGLFGGGGPFGGFAADGPFDSGGGGLPFNIFGPDT
ncbi:hypothetical protein KEM54_003873, partial [Ascosphaera aggregata]